MFPLIAAVALFSSVPEPTPVFQLNLAGELRLTKGALTPALRPGTQAIRLVGGTAIRFDGETSGLMLGDPPALRLTKSLSIACWVKVEAFDRYGVGSQLVFRGDDRNGLDPYSLSVSPTGVIGFLLVNKHNEYDSVSGQLQLNTWTHLLASLDDRTGEMLLWVNGRQVARKVTTIRPLYALDPSAAPGVSIGNVQFDRGPHNQPLKGEIADVRIYDRAITPTQMRFDPSGWLYPMR